MGAETRADVKAIHRQLMAFSPFHGSPTPSGGIGGSWRRSPRALTNALAGDWAVASGHVYSVTLTACHEPDTMTKPEREESGSICQD